MKYKDGMGKWDINDGMIDCICEHTLSGSWLTRIWGAISVSVRSTLLSIDFTSSCKNIETVTVVGYKLTEAKIWGFGEVGRRAGMGMCMYKLYTTSFRGQSITW
jgi:hypothetical protein